MSKRNSAFCSVLLLLFCSIFSLVNCNADIEGWIHIELQLALANSNEYVYHGNVTITNQHAGYSNIIQKPLTGTEQNQLKLLAKQNDLFHLRALVTDAHEGTKIYHTSSEACDLLLSRLNSALWVSIDQDGAVLALTLVPIGPDGSCDADLSSYNERNFQTDVLLRHSELAPVPDTAGFIQKIEREREARERGEVKDNRGFFAKYWMYIVPVLLLVFISGATNQEGAK